MHGLNKKKLFGLAALPVFALIAYLAAIHFTSRYHFNAAQEALERRDFRAANARLAKYLDLRPNDFSARLLAAQTARRRGDLAEAALHLEIYAKHHGQTNDLEARLLRLQTGDLAEAGPLLTQGADQPDAHDTPLILEAIIEGILKVLSAASQSVPIEEGELAAELARVKTALELWQRLYTRPIDQAQGLVWRARFRQLEQRQTDALVDLRKAVEIVPEFAEARLQLALAVFPSAPEEAARHLQWLHERYPEDRAVMFSLAATNRHLGRFEDAARLLDQLLAVSPDDYNYLLERGVVAINAKRLDDAERWLRRAHAISPKEPLVNLHLSGCLRLAGRDAEGQAFFKAGQMESDERQKKQEETARKYRAAAGKKN